MDPKLLKTAFSKAVTCYIAKYAVSKVYGSITDTMSIRRTSLSSMMACADGRCGVPLWDSDVPCIP